MSALTLELDSLLSQQSIDSCRFCGCTEEDPCPIYVAANPDGSERLARNEEETIGLMQCSWFIAGVCSSPLCIEKLLEEKRGKVLLFDAAGKTLKRAEGR